MTTGLVQDADAAHAALSPLRRTMLHELADPASASEIAGRLGLPRQKVNYHMTVLARHGLIELDHERRRRGFVERVYRRAATLVVAPDILGHGPDERDRWSKHAAVAAASDAIRATAALDDIAPTATMVIDVSFATPSDLGAFLEDVAALAARYDTAGDDRALPIRLSLLAHPVPDVGDVR